jgi:hypothetical protein
VLARRRVVAAPVVLVIGVIIGATMGYLGYLKPTF